MAEIDAFNAEKAKAALPPIEIEPYAEENVDFDTFCKSDFRAVKVKDCQPVKKSDKLLQFTLDDGTGTPRQILTRMEELRAIGLDVPHTVELLHGLRAEGFDVPVDALTVSECADVICAALKK